MARPSDYKPEYSEQAFKLCLLGAKDKELADFFGTSEQTLNTWKIKHPLFLESLKRGKNHADAEIANSLFEKAKGYRWREEVAVKYKIGKDLEDVKIIEVERVIPPDTTACIFWLKNRHKDKWRDKLETELTGKDGEAVSLTIITTGDKCK